MAKFDRNAKWGRREESRKAREASSHVCLGDPFMDMAREIGILVRSATVEESLVYGSKGKIKVVLMGDGTLAVDTDGTQGEEEIRRANEFLNSGGRIQGQIEELRMRKLRELVIHKASNGEFDEESAAIIFEPERAERLKVMASEISEIKGRISLVFGEAGLPEVVTTFGVYPNGPSKTNGVALEDLPYHIWYNRSYRPGRALIVHNQVWYVGIGVDEGKLESERQACMKESFPIATRPYH
ncbi:MAG: hypothetical protein ACRCTP_03885 [Aeromonas popoffii]|uniref:hypothetical protein n=1 Tax=Aeromonas popoffii TaxID=70856 RepID=UPI003F364DFD